MDRTENPEVVIHLRNELCACDSGLRASRCCALTPDAVPPAEATRHLLPLVERAMAAHAAGDEAVAERLCIDILELAPDRPRALLLLSDIRRKQGRMAAAEALLRRSLALDPNNFAALTELALLLAARGAASEAEPFARGAVRLAPDDPQAHNLMGIVMTEAHRPVVGEYHYRQALDLAGGARDPLLIANLATALRNQGRVEEARALYLEALAAAPDHAAILLNAAKLEEADRAFGAAASLLDRAESLHPADPALRLARATLLGRTGRAAEAVALLESAGPDGLGPAEWLEKGRLLDRLGRHDEAWAAFAAGKRLIRERTGLAYADAEVAEQFARLRGFFTAARLRILPRAGHREDTPQPIFVLGFPRSGTTLLEQTLSAHSRVAAGDELPLVGEITAIAPRLLASPLAYPEALSELWMGDQREGLDTLRDYYLQRVRQIGVTRGDKPFFTDKMPLNETHLGLIALLFPRAPLLHLIRHPLDVMVSAFSNDFTHGARCGSALETAARHYVRVADLVQHYRSEMALRYRPVRYEDLVMRQEAEVRSVLDFLGMPFEAGCLGFHHNRRYARTASYAQVTEPLYDRSVFRYRHYLRHLEPVIPILEDVIARLGYTVDAPSSAALAEAD